MTSRLLPNQYPAHPADRQTWRAHHCALLSGEWSGKSVKVDPKTGSLASETTWASTYMRFDPTTGQIKGEGMSLWEGQSYPFDIIGAFTPSFSQVELLKTHRNGGVTHLAFAIDLNTYILNGNFINGGTCILQKLPNNPAGSANVNNAANVGGYAPLHRQISNPNTNSNTVNASVAALVPPDLQSFLHVCFPDNSGTASSIYQLLRSQDLHDVESLTALSTEDWKEIGLNLGQRSKIKLQLQRFFPALVPRGGEDANGGATSPSADINNPNAAAASNPPYSSHYVSAQQQPLFHNNNPSYAAFAPQSSSAASAALQQQSSGADAPISYRCPITHELMEDPVVCSDGHSYDRVAISQWLEMKKTSPITGKILVSKSLQPNSQLKSAIQQWKAMHLK